MWFIPTTMPTTFIYCQNSWEKFQSHNLKVVVQILPPQPTISIKLMTEIALKDFGFWFFFAFKA